ncbi:MAG: hypothetical protein JOZ96_29075 [Acidobacteria bacterium]|nr:hypothetical protein [Acidobacteriota bacterium]
MTAVGRCPRCGLRIRISTTFCPACGLELAAPAAAPTAAGVVDYYAALDLPTGLTCEQLRVALREAYRVWSRRANNSPSVEQRHEAERKLLLIDDAEATLLDPARRRAYDEALNGHGGGGSAAPLPVVRRPVVPRQEPAAARGGDAPAEPPRVDPGGLRAFFGRRVLRGTIVQAEAPFTGHPDFDWVGVLLRLVVLTLALIFVGPVVLGVVIGLLVVWLMFSFVFPSATSHSAGCIGGLVNQMLGFFFTRKLFGPRREVQVRDYRLRDGAGEEHQLRVKGEIARGNMTVGDEVEVEGVDRGGMLIVRRGRNLRTRAEIVVRAR